MLQQFNTGLTMSDAPAVPLPRDPNSPVQAIPTDEVDGRPGPGSALCLSGGGYRAMVFHAGASGAFTRPASSCSCSGSRAYPAARSRPVCSALKWDTLTSGATPDRARFEREVVKPIREPRLRDDRRGVDRARPRCCPGRISDRVAAAYDEHLFHGATLQDLPDAAALRHQRHQRAVGRALALHEALHGATTGSARSTKPTHPAGAGGRRLVRLPAGAVAGRDAARPRVVHAGIGRRPAARAVHQQGHPQRRRGLRQPGPGDGLEALRRRSSSATAAAGSRRRRSPRATGRSTRTGCST